ncbi:MAG: hypothetical protein HC767_05200 [Akkermansiaceae bacterium]|nr:hypothetical protein [Akkermansiaceae bacterium]
MSHAYSLTPQFKDEAALKELKDTQSPNRPMWSNAAQCWSGPFIGAGHDEKVVRMSNALLGWKYGVALNQSPQCSFYRRTVYPRICFED